MHPENQKIRDYHEIELTKKIYELRRKRKIFERKLYIGGAVGLLIFTLIWLYLFGW